MQEAAGKLARFKFQRVVVSPFQRCLETAKLMTELLGLPPSRWQVDTAVCEVCPPCPCCTTIFPKTSYRMIHDCYGTSWPTALSACMTSTYQSVSVELRLQVLKPSTLVGTELKPPVGHAKDWMWNGDTVVHTLTRLLGPAGAEY